MDEVSNALDSMNKGQVPQVLVGLNSTDYEHAYDKTAMESVRNIPSLERIVTEFNKWTKVKWDIVDLCGSTFHVTRESCKDLCELVKRTSEILYLDHVPSLYIQEHYDIYAFTIGHEEDAYIIFNSGAIDKLNDKELMFMLGREMGHIKSNHVVYQCLGTYIGAMVKEIPFVGEIGAKVISLPIEKWRRMADFTADRAGLLACQDINSALSAIMKMAGLPERYYESASVSGFIAQAERFKNRQGNSIIEKLKSMGASHPWNVLRAAELIEWYNSEEYEKILAFRKGKMCPECRHYYPIQQKICPRDGYRWE